MADRTILGLVSTLILLRHWYASGLFWFNHHRLPAISVPQDFNDKIFWRKTVDHNPMFVTFNDKIAVRDWVSETVPELEQTKLLWQGKDPSDIPDDVFGQPVMIKANHGCGWNLAYDGTKPDRAEIEEVLTDWLGQVFGGKLGEWAYSEIEPYGLIEELLAFADGSSPYNFNIHTSNGKILFVGIYSGDKKGKRTIGFFSENGERLPVQVLSADARMDQNYVPPPSFHTAIKAARMLSQNVDYVRCDFMATDDRVWYNEITTYTGSGHLKLTDHDLVNHLSQDWDISRSWFLTAPQKGWRSLYQAALCRELARRSNSRQKAP